MGDASFLQSSFLGGQWSDFYQGRADDAKYPTAMSLCLNAMPVEEGPCARRSGTRHAGVAHNGAPVARMISFPFSDANPYTIELTESTLRLWSGSQIVTATPVTIASTSAASPTVFTTTTPHGMTTGANCVFA